MMFAVGDRLGRFEILGALGAGGMGEVYRARDPQLQRDVAIKVLPSEFSSDPVRRRRFEHEARAAGGLNHPNILAVYDVGIESHTSYIVTEVLEGQTMGERLEGKPLPARKTAEYARQIASGLAAAHARGVVHRDIKPGNLFVTTDGRVKILDFGLAKFVGPEAENTDSITVSVEGLQQKPILGSLTYMSPEQARGIRLDHRTDIFSFGVVLYEMLAGFAPFRRPTPGETMQAILHEDVPALPASTPEAARLERLVRHCLEKNPSERFQNVHDLVFDLDTQAVDSATDTVTRRWSPTQIAATLLLVLASGAAGAFIATQLQPEPPADLHRVRTVTNTVGLEEFAAISPNGDMVAFTQVEGRHRQLFVRSLRNSSAPLRVTSSAETDHQSPRWSPDGTLLFFSPAGPGEVQGTIYRAPALGGSLPQRVMASIGGGDISRSGRLACFRLDQDRIELITATLDGSDLRVVARLKAQHYQYPRWSPDEQTIAFQAGDGFRWDLYTVPAGGGSEPTQLTRDSKVVKGLAWLPDNSGLIFASARASSFSYLPPLTLWQVSRNGTRLRQLTSPEASYEQPDLDPNGLLAATHLQMRYDIWEYQVDRETTAVDRGRRVTRQTGQVGTPAVSPDGLKVAYISDHGGHANIWIAPLDGRSSPQQLTSDDDPDVSIGVPAWSPDGQWIAYLSSKGNGGLKFGVWLIRPDGSDNKRIVPLGLSPQWSRDSQWLYYVEESHRPIKRVDVRTGATETVHKEPARNVIGVHAGTVYYGIDRALVDGRKEFDLRAAPIGGGQSRLVTTLPTAQTPDWQIINPALSPDGLRLAVPLTDGFTTNIWTISTDNGQRKERVTNFGDSAIFISRQLAWSMDGKSVLAAIGEGDADIVLLDGLFRRPAGVR